jgi:nucleotide-binding universal stress UspA family protein
LVLVHAIPWQVLATPEGGEVALPPDPREEDYYRDKLEAFGQQILPGQPGAAQVLEAACIRGTLQENLPPLVHRRQAALVVMGTRQEVHFPVSWLGTHTWHYLQQADCPVLVVPEKAAFQALRRIAYASDFEVEDESGYLHQLLAFTAPFNPQLYIVNVKSDRQLRVVPDWQVLDNLQRQFPENPFCIAQMKEEDIPAALTAFVLDNQIDILAIGRQHRSFLERLFHTSVSRELALHPPRPLLVLPPP